MGLTDREIDLLVKAGTHYAGEIKENGERRLHLSHTRKDHRIGRMLVNEATVLESAVEKISKLK